MNLWKTAFKKFEDSFQTFKGCLPQISLGPFLNTLSHIIFKTSDLNPFKVGNPTKLPKYDFCQNSIFFRYFKIFPDIRSNFFQKQSWIHPETHKTLINLSYQNTIHLSKYSTFGKPLYSEFLLTTILWFIYYFCLGKILRSFIWLQPFQTKYNPRRQNFV